MNLHYETHGAGEPLVLIAGFASGAWKWFAQVEELSKNFQVITFDPRGIGHSKFADEDLQSLSMQTFASDVRAILDELKIEKANILGASFGGFVAQEFAFKFPERLKKLVLVCTSFGGKNHVSPDLETLAAFAPSKDLNSAERIRKYMRPAFTEEFYAANPKTVEKICALREHNEVAEIVYMQQLKAAMMFDAQSRVAKIEAETLVITGAEDRVVPMQNSINLANLIPKSRLEIIENGSHLFFIEQAEKFNKIVTNFVNS